jgi:hypothetical protein
MHTTVSCIRHSVDVESKYHWQRFHDQSTNRDTIAHWALICLYEIANYTAELVPSLFPFHISESSFTA